MSYELRGTERLKGSQCLDEEGGNQMDLGRGAVTNKKGEREKRKKTQEKEDEKVNSERPKQTQRLE